VDMAAAVDAGVIVVETAAAIAETVAAAGEEDTNPAGFYFSINKILA